MNFVKFGHIVLVTCALYWPIANYYRILAMSLKRLARELDETTRQTKELVDGIINALNILQNSDDCCEDANKKAIHEIIIALQGQDRIEQRCNNMALAIRKMVERDSTIDNQKFDEIWSHMTLDELAIPKMSGIAARIEHGEVDLF